MTWTAIGGPITLFTDVMTSDEIMEILDEPSIDREARQVLIEQLMKRRLQ